MFEPIERDIEKDVVYVGIKDGKIYDLCSDLANKRDNTIDDSEYIELDYNRIFDFEIDDTWNFEANDSLHDSALRTKAPELNVKEQELKNQLDDLEARVSALEASKVQK